MYCSRSKGILMSEPARPTDETENHGGRHALGHPAPRKHAAGIVAKAAPFSQNDIDVMRQLDEDYLTL